MQTPLFLAIHNRISPTTEILFQNTDDTEFVGFIQSKIAHAIIPSLVNLKVIDKNNNVLELTSDHIIKIQNKEPLQFASSIGIDIEKHVDPRTLDDEQVVRQGRPSTVPSISTLLEKVSEIRKAKRRNNDFES